jgi:hypothetical protein
MSLMVEIVKNIAKKVHAYQGKFILF